MKSTTGICVALLICSVCPKVLFGQNLLFPQLDDWTLTQEETVYTPNNLFDVIDGAADLYPLEYNFVDLHIGRYANGELEVKVELYKHGTAVDAFGIFSQERFADYHFINLGVQGYIEKGALNFLSGIYYVKISTIQEGSSAQDAMLLIAKAVEQDLKQDKSYPVMLQAFPLQKKKANSEQYTAKSFLGYSPLNSVFVASYDDEPPFRAFVIRAATLDDARKTLANFEKALPTTVQKSMAAGTTLVRDPNNGSIEIALQGRYLYGVVSPESARRHVAFLREFSKTITSIQ